MHRDALSGGAPGSTCRHYSRSICCAITNLPDYASVARCMNYFLVVGWFLHVTQQVHYLFNFIEFPSVEMELCKSIIYEMTFIYSAFNVACSLGDQLTHLIC